MKKNITLIVLIVFGFASNAKNKFIIKPENALLTKVLKQLNLKESDVQESLYVEKIIPYNRLLTIMVIPKIETKEIDEYKNSFYEFGLYVVIVENKTGEIKGKFYESKALTSDAIVLSGIEIDTASYDINKMDRTFGVRINYSGSSQPNPFNKTELSLFTENRITLKRVLKNYIVSEFHGEWDTNCVGEFEKIESSIKFDTQKMFGFNDLIINQEITNQINKKINDDCNEIKTVRNKKLFLQYNSKTRSYN